MRGNVWNGCFSVPWFRVSSRKYHFSAIPLPARSHKSFPHLGIRRQREKRVVALETRREGGRTRAARAACSFVNLLITAVHHENCSVRGGQGTVFDRLIAIMAGRAYTEQTCTEDYDDPANEAGNKRLLYLSVSLGNVVWLWVSWTRPSSLRTVASRYYATVLYLLIFSFEERIFLPPLGWC